MVSSHTMSPPLLDLDQVRLSYKTLNKKKRVRGRASELRKEEGGTDVAHLKHFKSNSEFWRECEIDN